MTKKTKDSISVYSQYRGQAAVEKTGVVINAVVAAQRQQIDQKVAAMPKEFGGRPKDKGLEPTRYGDWELKGRCVDF